MAERKAKAKLGPRNSARWKAHKAAYDRARRAALGDALLAEKRAAYHALAGRARGVG